ncbi:MAG: hypothetical protein H5T41_01400 [Methanomassiliicoccales archaeon]|nr:hypothetical protein [Methanomassiliicoccales archaeon]
MKKRIVAIAATAALFLAAFGVVFSTFIPLGIPGNDPHKILSGNNLGIPGNDPHSWVNGSNGSGAVSGVYLYRIPGNDPHSWEPLLGVQILGIPGNDPH